jgi:acyl-CoA thioesterase-1
VIRGRRGEPVRSAAFGSVALAFVSLSAPASAQRGPAPALSAAEACLAATAGLSLGAGLPRTKARLRAGEPLVVVAIGSSSTTGFGTWSAEATYPEVMRRELQRLRPGAQVAVINSGRIGETVPGNLARFQDDVIRHRPDLVIWQLGTNDVVWRGMAEDLEARIAQGVRALRAAGADVVLMDLQYAPAVTGSSTHPEMQRIIADAARQERVGLFSRFALMRRAIEAGVPQREIVAWDGLHHTTEGYDCIGRALARAIHAAAR